MLITRLNTFVLMGAGKVSFLFIVYDLKWSEAEFHYQTSLQHLTCAKNHQSLYSISYTSAATLVKGQ